MQLVEKLKIIGSAPNKAIIDHIIQIPSSRLADIYNLAHCVHDGCVHGTR
jgi:hypothetical protein